MGYRNRNEQGNNRNHDSRDENRAERREPLQWQEEDKIQHGFTVGTINSAERQDGTRIYSWCLGKQARNGDRVMKFMDPRDFEDARKVITGIQDWIEEEQSAECGA